MGVLTKLGRTTSKNKWHADQLERAYKAAEGDNRLVVRILQEVAGLEAAGLAMASWGLKVRDNAQFDSVRFPYCATVGLRGGSEGAGPGGKNSQAMVCFAEPLGALTIRSVTQSGVAVLEAPVTDMQLDLRAQTGRLDRVVGPVSTAFQLTYDLGDDALEQRLSGMSRGRVKFEQQENGLFSGSVEVPEGVDYHDPEGEQGFPDIDVKGFLTGVLEVVAFANLTNRLS